MIVPTRTIAYPGLSPSFQQLYVGRRSKIGEANRSELANGFEVFQKRTKALCELLVDKFKIVIVPLPLPLPTLWPA